MLTYVRPGLCPGIRQENSPNSGSSARFSKEIAGGTKNDTAFFSNVFGKYEEKRLERERWLRVAVQSGHLLCLGGEIGEVKE